MTHIKFLPQGVSLCSLKGVVVANNIEEVWAYIVEFPDYKVSNLGRIYNTRLDEYMRISRTQFGHSKITLVSSWDGKRYTRSVANLVAERFVMKPGVLCDHVVLLDGDQTNLAAYNMVWRPSWFSWKYARQLRTQQPRYFFNLPVCDVTTGIVYESIAEAGMTLGLLFEDIWKSCSTGLKIYPDGAIFQTVKRV